MRTSSSLGSIRKQCMERIKKDREAKQWSARRSAGTPRAVSEESCRGRARAILDDVLSTRSKRRRSACASDDDDDDGGGGGGGGARGALGDRASSTSAAGDPALGEGGDGAGDEALSAQEEAALVSELQEEIRAYEQEQADRFAHEVAMEALAAEAAGLAFDEDEALGEDDTVLCPVCSGGYLGQSPTLEIYCAHCDLSLPDQLDGLGLGHLRDLLAATFEAHAARGCEARPAFAVDRQLGIAILRCTCRACAFQHVVI